MLARREAPNIRYARLSAPGAWLLVTRREGFDLLSCQRASPAEVAACRAPCPAACQFQLVVLPHSMPIRTAGLTQEPARQRAHALSPPGSPPCLAGTEPGTSRARQMPPATLRRRPGERSRAPSPHRLSGDDTAQHHCSCPARRAPETASHAPARPGQCTDQRRTPDLLPSRRDCPECDYLPPGLPPAARRSSVLLSKKLHKLERSSRLGVTCGNARCSGCCPQVKRRVPTLVLAG